MLVRCYDVLLRLSRCSSDMSLSFDDGFIKSAECRWMLDAEEKKTEKREDSNLQLPKIQLSFRNSKGIPTVLWLGTRVGLGSLLAS